MSSKVYNVGPVTKRSMPFWCLQYAGGDPFGGAILDPLDSLVTAELICWAVEQGLIEETGFHDDDLVAWDSLHPEDDLDESGPVFARLSAIRNMFCRFGVGVHTATCSLHGNPIFRNGGLTNPDPKIRELAKLKVQRCLRIGQFFGATSFTYWVARDGFEVPILVSPEALKWLKEGLDGVTDYIQKKNMTNYKMATIEAKPNEPRGHMFLPTTGHAIGFMWCLKNPAFWQVNPELLQHEGMAGLNAVNTVLFAVHLGKLGFLHFGSQIKCQFDNDFPPLVGPEGLKETVTMFNMLARMGWSGVVEFDCHMLRCEADPQRQLACKKEFIINCSRALAVALALAKRIQNFNAQGMGASEADIESVMAMCGLTSSMIAQLVYRTNGEQLSLKLK